VVFGAFSEGLVAIRVDGLWGYMNRAGDIVIEPRFQEAYTFTNGVAGVRAGRVLTFVDTTGRLLFDPEANRTGP